jgi:hypothetical protein
VTGQVAQHHPADAQTQERGERGRVELRLEHHRGVQTKIVAGTAALSHVVLIRPANRTTSDSTIAV